jgi:hypothetical protein
VESKDQFLATCTPGNKVLGCHVRPIRQPDFAYESWRAFYPTLDGAGADWIEKFFILAF